jgi:hypothetical protein
MVNQSKFWTGVALLFLAMLSLAQSSRKHQIHVIHTASIGACTFRLTDPLGGRLDDSDKLSSFSHADYDVELPRLTIPARFHIVFACDTGDPVQVCREFAGADRTPHGWTEWYTPDQGPAPKKARLEVHAFRSVNGVGAVQLHNWPESAIGPPSRSLGFCLTAPNGATLYGGTIVDEFSGKHKPALSG